MWSIAEVARRDISRLVEIRLKGRFPFGVLMKKQKKKTRGKKKKLNNVQLSFESASVKICKNKLTNQIEEKAENFSTRE